MGLTPGCVVGPCVLTELWSFLRPPRWLTEQGQSKSGQVDWSSQWPGSGQLSPQGETRVKRTDHWNHRPAAKLA